jgi:hypothetical protein
MSAPAQSEHQAIVCDVLAAVTFGAAPVRRHSQVICEQANPHGKTVQSARDQHGQLRVRRAGLRSRIFVDGAISLDLQGNGGTTESQRSQLRSAAYCVSVIVDMAGLFWISHAGATALFV